MLGLSAISASRAWEFAESHSSRLLKLKMLLALPYYVGAEAVKHSYTLFLFTKSDIKTTLIPITLFATAAAPDFVGSNLPQAIFWLWLHLLQFDVSNQSMSPEEDEQNKRWRPLPSKRLTLRQARILRWLLVPVCLAVSCLYSLPIIYASISLISFTVIYNELSGHSHWLVRNVVNACGAASFEVGTTLLASQKYDALDSVAVLSILLSAGINATTIQAQDFKDVHGDRAIGRRTLPIILPGIARYTILAGLTTWSVGLAWIWKLDWATAFVFLSIAGIVASRFQFLTSVREDQVSYYWYNVWLSFAHALPWYYRRWRT
ncbi:hypothetical protein NM688_g1400 [Phlebia brevispora]|uniref:Uncharacterized protein n=1 Tax=Phlebia brevispora TaxID=194682 RepID=A0ACC1TBT7_9APHY|nr:hypothetical protein NM688_g1400 [Phlebia brevispora]